VTGDLTNIALEDEFPHARAWLERIGAPDRVTAVPGNHDAYVRVPRERSWDLWAEYMVSDEAGEALMRDLGVWEKPGGLKFPTVRLRDDLALIGLSSARPTPLFFASGSLGASQRDRLERLLAALGERGRVRVVLVHHPPTPGATSRRRALVDARLLCDVIRRVGAELVLHGHLHRTRFARIPGPSGEVPVIGVRSASDVGERPGRRAQYHLYDIASGRDGCPPRIGIRTRGYDAATGGFRGEGEPSESVPSR
jgi:3',5'-cyclic AMP phosphodiesterase CpdA